MEKSSGLQALRGLAASLVVMHHYIGTAVAKGFGPDAWAHTELGAVGIDIFFVISGFIMEFVVITRPAGHSRPGEFLLRRAIRVLPLNWAMLLLAVLGFFVIGNGPVLHVSPKRVLTSALLLPNGAIGPDGYVIPMAWTLTFEAYFYLVFSSTLGLKPDFRLLRIGVLFTSCVAIGLWLKPQFPLAQLVCEPLLFEFLAGCVIANMWHRGWRLPTAAAMLLFATACFALWIIDRLGWTGPRPLIWGIPCWFLVASVVLARHVGMPTALRPTAMLGDVSYSLYLSHFFVVAAFQRLVTKYLTLGQTHYWVLAIAFSVLAVLAALASYRLIEKPSRRILGRVLLGK